MNTRDARLGVRHVVVIQDTR